MTSVNVLPDFVNVLLPVPNAVIAFGELLVPLYPTINRSGFPSPLKSAKANPPIPGFTNGAEKLVVGPVENVPVPEPSSV